MAFDFNDYDEEGKIKNDFPPEEKYNIENEELRYKTIRQAIDLLGKTDLSWTDDKNKLQTVCAIVDATAKAAFHRGKGYLSSDKNSIVHENEIAELFRIDDNIWQHFIGLGVDRFNGVLIELPNRYLYLSDYSERPEIPIEQSYKILINSLPLDKDKSVFAFHSQCNLKRGSFDVPVSELPNFKGALYVFRGIYGVDGKHISDYATL